MIREKKNLVYIFVLLLSLIGCGTKKSDTNHQIQPKVERDTLTYFDESRNRKIPVAFYKDSNQEIKQKTPILFSHGYGMNLGDAYINDYAYLLEALAKNGYFVVSIQHELTTDELLSRELPAKKIRMPNWKRGAENIGYVLQRLKKDYPELNFNKTVLIGHSNGGDQSALFTLQHPELINKLIAMDNRRMDLPKTSKPRIYTLRSNDHPADEGVLPSEDEQKKYKITVQPTQINHDKMDKDATEEERNYLITKILEYLNEK